MLYNVPEARNFAFVGAPWADQIEAAASPSATLSMETPNEAWAFVVIGVTVTLP